jgi:hypothetical protein
MREWNFVGDRVWDADRPLTFDAFLTTDGWAFRFPRRAETGSLFESEARVHRLVTRFLPRHVTVPRVELLATPAADFPYPIAGHRFIDGVALYSVGEHLMPTLAREIATALGDAAGDFAFLVTWRGWESAESVLRHYPCAIDPGFRDRLRFISQMLSTMWLALAVEQGSDLTYCIPPVYNAFAIRD